MSELQDSIKRIEGELEEMKRKLASEDKHNNLSIPEWRQLAELGDVLVEVSDDDDYIAGYLKVLEYDSKYVFRLYDEGTTSKTAIEPNTDTGWIECRLIEDNRWRLNEGKQPVPDCVRVEALFRDGNRRSYRAYDIPWSLSYLKLDVLAYRIIGVGE